MFAQSLRLLDHADTDQHAVLKLLQAFAARMVPCGADLTPSEEIIDDTEWLSFPFSSSWQDSHTRSLSLLVHNLCVANSVALFSGWEEKEFTLDLMRRERKNNYFGITLNAGRIVGYLDADIANRLADTWIVASTIVGTAIDVVDSLGKAVTFLQVENHVAPPPDNGDDVAIYGEKDALAIFIEYAKRCLVIASASNSTKERSELIKIAMSVLLPIVST